MNKVYGFEGECKAKLGEMTYKLFADVFTSRASLSSLQLRDPAWKMRISHARDS